MATNNMKKEGNSIKCQTGISGFDPLCDGGLIRGSSNVIMGGPGTGKTTFLLQFLYQGYKDFGENGMYVSFEPDRADLIETGKLFGWDLDKLDKDGKIIIYKCSPKSSV